MANKTGIEYQFSGDDVQKLRKKGSTSMKDIEAMCKACNVKVDTGDKKDDLILNCENRDVLDILTETIDCKHLDRTEAATLTRGIDIKGKVITFIWKFSEKATPVIKHFHSTELDKIKTFKDCSWKMEEQRKTRKCLTIRSSLDHVSDINSETKRMVEEYTEQLHYNNMKSSGKQKVKLFCKECNTKETFCWVDDMADKIIICSYKKAIADQLQEKWEQFVQRLQDEEEKEKVGNSPDEYKDVTDDHEERDEKMVDKKEEQNQPSAESSVSPESTFTQPTFAQHLNDKGDSSQQNIKQDTREINNDIKQSDLAKPKMILVGSATTATGNEHYNQDFHVKTVTAAVVGDVIHKSPKYEFPIDRLRVFVYKQSVTDIKYMDAIVNAANDQLVHAGGIAGYISKAAGQAMDDECRKYISKHGPLKDSEVFVSSSGKMSCKKIFHAVGPRWADYLNKEDNCAEVLHRTIYNCLEKMKQNNWSSIAMCAISSGIFGVPKKLCTAMYIKAFEDFATQNPHCEIDVHFIDVNQEIIDLMIGTHRERVTIGRSPDFDEAFKYKNLHNQNNSRQGHFGQAKHHYKAPWDKTGWTEVTRENTTIPEPKQRRLGINHSSQREAKPTEAEAKPAEKNKTSDTASKDMCHYHKSAVVSKTLKCGHGFCTACSPNNTKRCTMCNYKGAENINTTDTGKSEKTTTTDKDKTVNIECGVCLDTITEAKTLDCQHTFCKDCVDYMAKKKPLCPICKQPFGIVTGYQPNGNMFYRILENKSLPGYDGKGTIEISYRFPDGIQLSEHPNPGAPYKGIVRNAYLPDNEKGRKVLAMLKIAFLQRLIFTIGDSRTTGMQGVITWNDIHHKTDLKSGGQFGYPDPGYLDRVTEELAANGITE